MKQTSILDFKKPIEPLAKKTSVSVKKTTQTPSGGPMSYEDINVWSDFAEKNHRPGMGFEELWGKFQKQNPNTKIDKNVLLEDINKLQNYNREFISRKGLDALNIEDVNTGYSFPKVIIDGKDYGRVNAKGETATKPKIEQSLPVPASMMRRSIPADINVSTLMMDKGYPSWKEGEDVVYAYNTPTTMEMFRRLIPQNQQK